MTEPRGGLDFRLWLVELPADETEFLLIRHGEAAYDALPDPLPPGQQEGPDPPLTELGRQQARALAARLAVQTPPISAVYASDLQRTVETAEALAAGVRLPVQYAATLREMALRPEARERVRRDPGLLRRPGMFIELMEPLEQVRARVLAELQGIAARHPGERVAVVMHGGTINAVATAALNLEARFVVAPFNTSITVVRLAPENQVRLVTLNDVAHLSLPGMVTDEPVHPTLNVPKQFRQSSGDPT